MLKDQTIVVAPIALVIGVFFVAVGWVGCVAMHGTWPGPSRLVLGSVIGVSLITWGLSAFRRLLVVGGGRVALSPLHVVVVVLSLIAGVGGLLALYNW